jgi:hypothetical protein
VFVYASVCVCASVCQAIFLYVFVRECVKCGKYVCVCVCVSVCVKPRDWSAPIHLEPAVRVLACCLMTRNFEFKAN